MKIGANNYQIEVLDVDGTISSEGSDLWFECSERLIEDKEPFLEALKQWRIKKAVDPFDASLWMMKKSATMLSAQYGSIAGELIYKTAYKITLKYCVEKNIRDSALEIIRAALVEGRTVVFSSTNYIEGAQAFCDVLFREGLIPQRFKNHVLVSGTEINWADGGSIRHFNMDHGKVEALINIFSNSKDTLRSRTIRAFGDDPRGNDRGILELAQNAYVVTTQKNKDQTLPSYFGRVHW